MNGSLRIALLALWLPVSGCAGVIVGTAVDVGIEVVKIPFKIGGAVIDVVTDDDEAEEGD